MALTKSTSTDLGIDATYARIAAAQMHYDAGQCVDVQMLLYVDEAKRRDKKQPIAKWEKRFTFAELGTKEPTRADIYAAVKLSPEWADAKDA